METSPERPVSVAWVAATLKQYIGALGGLWIEGEITKSSSRRGNNYYLTLRDGTEDAGLSMACRANVWEPARLADGMRVVVQAKASYWEPNGSLTWWINAVQAVGTGDLLARLEALKQRLAAEGLFDRKRPIPFLPATIGLITGKDSDAEKDFLKVSAARWPARRVEVVHTRVQGPEAPGEVIAALRRLDADPGIDVIVITRGGGSMEDVILPFSDEALVRAVAAAQTPVVVAIGHEQDTPLVDWAADLRASTPSNAAEQVVPDVSVELDLIAGARTRLARGVAQFVEGELRWLDQMRLRAPQALRSRVDRGLVEAEGLRARVRALSPLETLQRGYAVVTDGSGHVVTATAAAKTGAALNVRVTDGTIETRVV